MTKRLASSLWYDYNLLGQEKHFKIQNVDSVLINLNVINFSFFHFIVNNIVINIKHNC